MRFTLSILALVWFLAPALARADGPAVPPSDGAGEPIIPPELQGVEIVEHIGAAVPLDMPFVDETGKAVKLGDYFHAGKPVVLTLNYYECPMLCNLVLNGFTDGLRGLEWVPGKDFEIVTVSINHREGPALAKAKKDTYMTALGKPEAVDGWHFLTGQAEDIRRLTSLVGFGYRWDPSQMQYAHGAAIILLTPDGIVARYLYGIDYPEKVLRLSLVEASEGTLGSVVDKVLLYCFHYVPSARRYEFYIWGAMRLGAVLTILIVGSVLAVFWRRERRQTRIATLESRMGSRSG